MRRGPGFGLAVGLGGGPGANRLPLSLTHPLLRHSRGCNNLLRGCNNFLRGCKAFLTRMQEFVTRMQEFVTMQEIAISCSPRGPTTPNVLWTASHTTIRHTCDMFRSPTTAPGSTAVLPSFSLCSLFKLLCESTPVCLLCKTNANPQKLGLRQASQSVSQQSQATAILSYFQRESLWR